MDLTSEEERKGLHKLLNLSKKRLSPFLENHRKLIEDYVGDGYGTLMNEKKRTIFNFMAAVADTQTMSLVGHRPRCHIKTHYRELVPFARRYTQAVNNLAKDIHLEETLRRVVLDSFFSVGILKVYRAPSGEEHPFPNPDMPIEPGPMAPPEAWEEYSKKQAETPYNIWIDPGKPMVERISLEDFVWDMDADSWEKIKYAAHEYRVPLSTVKSDPRFDEDVVKLVKSSSKWDKGSVFEEGKEQVRNLSQGNESRVDEDEMWPMVTLMDVWIPEDRKWAVMVADQPELGPLFEEEWDGPKEGPFHLLTLISDVPDNIMPISPASHIRHLHMVMNSMMRKLVRQAATQKTVNFYRDARDGEAFRTANDGDFMSVSDTRNITSVRSGGPDQQSYSFFQGIESLASMYSGNLHAQAGMGPQADTATQESLIHSAVSNREARMRQNVVAFSSTVFKHMAYLLWVDEVHRSVSLSEMGSGLTLGGPQESRWEPGERQGDFFQYNFDVEESSMPYKSPAERAKSITEFIGILAQFGVQPNMEELVNLWADFHDLPGLRQVVDLDSMQANPPAQQQGSKPSNTTTIHERRDTKGRSPFPTRNQTPGNESQTGSQPAMSGGYQ